MLNIKERSYGLLLVAAIAVSVVLVFLPIADSDFQDKTMFSVPLAVFIWAIPLLLLAFWMFYLLTKRFLFSKRITWTHVVITFSTTILAVVILYIVSNPLQSVSNNIFGTNGAEIIGDASRFIFILFVFGQFTFLINVLLGLYRTLTRHPLT